MATAGRNTGYPYVGLLVAVSLLATVLVGCSRGDGSKQVGQSTATAPPILSMPVITPVSTPAITPVPTPITYTLVGSISSYGNGENPQCSRFHTDHAPVTVRDAAGVIIGTTMTSGNTAPVPTPYPWPTAPAVDPQFVEHLPALGAYAKAGAACVNVFSVALPRATFYQITVGTHGGPNYSFEQMQSMGWKLDLVLNTSP